METLEREEQQRLEAQRKKEEIERMTQEVEKSRDQPVQQSEIVSSFCCTVARSSFIKMPGMDIDVR